MYCDILIKDNLKNNIRESTQMCSVLHIKFVLLHDLYVQKESVILIGMATVSPLPTFSSWLSVAQLHMPEEQISW